ncbi:hypothetical protein CC85DRAFT_305724 [Cutaneotrichosporon oleaginosum]|uniref:Uncharacterized protein n=1 Tax=Cutaneotrichosporon oleaginosum TaxID=879819 RepID=A0A0J0XC93_9TREE|nr:uncharacterized protein CC85DRAFT_305724 [Cutaneotrichosporon oleaginosum]KLT38698.1 hypothetical protein CC85DRAFT_305724 [Cutaneotrichosporon oleaginosum]TXT07579.1 hypothetical protein COLE_04503 [Cutaneotrichosporon oleaginosum]
MSFLPSTHLISPFICVMTSSSSSFSSYSQDDLEGPAPPAAPTTDPNAPLPTVDDLLAVADIAQQIMHVCVEMHTPTTSQNTERATALLPGMWMALESVMVFGKHLALMMHERGALDVAAYAQWCEMFDFTTAYETVVVCQRTPTLHPTRQRLAREVATRPSSPRSGSEESTSDY